MIWVEGCSAFIPDDSSAGAGGGDFPLRIMTAGAREYILICESEEQRNFWVSELKSSQFSHVQSTLAEANSRADAHGEKLASESAALEEARDLALKEVASLKVELLAAEKSALEVQELKEKELAQIRKEAEENLKSKVEAAEKRFAEEAASANSAQEAAAEAAAGQIQVLETELSAQASKLEAQAAEAQRERERAAAAASELEEELALTSEQAREEENLAAAAMDELVLENMKLEQAATAAKVEADMLRRARGLHRRHPAGPAVAPSPASPGGSGGGGAGGDEAAAAGAEKPIRLWVGTWNLGAAEPFEPNAPIGTRILRDSLVVDDPCDIYFLGLQEGASESVFNAFEALSSILASCERLPLSAEGAAAAAAAAATSASSSSSSSGSGGGGALSASAGAGSSSGGSSSSSSGQAVAASADDHQKDRDKIHGRGDGSLIGTKFTGLACYVRKALLGHVRVLACVAHGVEKLGSKGGVAVALDVRGSTLVLATSHLEAMKRDTRRAQYRELMTSLGGALGERGFDLPSQFHHVIWTGDLNYRCVERTGETMPADRACALLRSGKNAQLFEDHDELRQEMRAREAFAPFSEPVPQPDFYPTYKKLENRTEATDYASSDWVAKVYRTRYKEQIYKGGKVKERTPGFCDRILFCSLPDAAPRLVPERKTVVHDLVLGPSSSSASTSGAEAGGTASFPSEADNYCAVNDGPGMSVSDHSPVYGVFLLHPTRSSASARFTRKRNMTVVTPTASPGASLLDAPAANLEVLEFHVRGGKETPEGTQLDVLFPAPFEVQDGSSFVTVGNQANGWVEEPTKAKTECRRASISDHVFSTSGAMPKLRLAWDSSGAARGQPVGVGNLHLLLRVSGGIFTQIGHNHTTRDDMRDTFAGCCALCLSDLKARDDATYIRDADTGDETEIILQFQGVPLSCEGRPLFYPADSQVPLTVDLCLRVTRPLK